MHAARAVHVEYGPPDQPGIFSIEQARERSAFYNLPVRSRAGRAVWAEGVCGRVGGRLRAKARARGGLAHEATAGVRGRAAPALPCC